MLAGLGATRQAFEAANSALDHQRLQPRFLFTPVTRNLRQDPAFVGLSARMGLVKYWRETGKRRTSAPLRQVGANAARKCWLR